MTRCEEMLGTFWKAPGWCRGQRWRILESLPGRRRVQLSAWRCRLLAWEGGENRLQRGIDSSVPVCLRGRYPQIYQRRDSKRAVINTIWNLYLRAKRDHASISKAPCSPRSLSAGPAWKVLPPFTSLPNSWIPASLPRSPVQVKGRSSLLA